MPESSGKLRWRELPGVVAFGLMLRAVSDRQETGLNALQAWAPKRSVFGKNNVAAVLANPTPIFQ